MTVQASDLIDELDWIDVMSGIVQREKLTDAIDQVVDVTPI
jgi:hypothetical protein